MIYSAIQPIIHKIEPDRQGARRHYGVHPYFTRRPYNVVRDYIAHYSSPGDKVLDPFGGSGVTAIEAFLLSRNGIQNDINPLANFIADGIFLLAQFSEKEIQNAYIQIIDTVTNPLNKILKQKEADIESAWSEYEKKLSLPLNIPLPKNSDAKTYHELFTKKQLIALSVIKTEIDKIENATLRHVVLLGWSATLSKINKTFLSTEGRKESRGGSSIFSIYRYKIAAQPVELNPLEVFVSRTKNILKAHKEIRNEIQANAHRFGMKGGYESYSFNATELDKKFQHELDYVFTDPPYGAHIAYLDLSTLWNLWLGKLPDKSVYESELIVGGETKHTEDYYIENLFKSVQTIASMLKDNRFFSVVFQHKNVAYFEAILEAAYQSNSELIASVSQETGTVWSMHKKKGKHSVLAGELIITFRKQKGKIKPIKSSQKDFQRVVEDYIENKKSQKIISEEEIFNDLVIECWNEGLIHELSYSKLDIPEMLEQLGFSYDEKNHSWKKNKDVPQIEMF
jgi:16S rRNA G966 N2-methylase RsmD